MKTTLSRRLGLAVLGIIAATATLTPATAANAAEIHPNRTDGHVTSLDIVTSPAETQDLIHGGYGFGSTGAMICANQVAVPLSFAFYWVDEHACGTALTRCAKLLDDGQHPDQVAAVEWVPESRGWLGGQWTCLTWLTGPSGMARVVWESQHPANGG